MDTSQIAMNGSATSRNVDAPDTAGRGEPGLFPCSLAQRRFWALDRLHDGVYAAGNVAVRWRLEGQVTTAELEQAFRQIIERHEVLRAHFVEIDGEPHQRIETQVPLRIADIDLRNLGGQGAEAELQRLSLREARTPFDLAGPPPLLRVVRVRLAENVSVLLVTLHHIVCDGWSIGVLAQEMGELCAAQQEQRAAALPALAQSYGRHAARQRQWLAGGGAERLGRYWRRQLRDLPQFELPPDHPRPPVLSSNAHIVSRLLPRALSDALAAHAREQGCTLFMLMLSALLVLLHRYSGESDIVVGTQAAGRDEAALEPLIGLFVNTLVLRCDVSGDPSFDALLGRVADVVLDAFEHGAMPIEELIEILRPPRDRSRNPLFSINFVMQRSFISNRRYGQFQLIDMPSVSAGALHDLNLFMVERPDGWRLSCDHNTDLFDSATVERLLAHFERLLAAIVAQPRQAISRLPLLDDAERHRLTVDWNRSAADYPLERNVVDLFEGVAAFQPQAVAVACGTRQLTYAELDAGANRLAHELRARGFGDGQRIAVFVRRSPDLVVTLLGIIKAGCTYVPLDTGNPPERLTAIIGGAGIAAIVTRSAEAAALAQVDVPMLLLDRDAARIAAQRSAAPPRTTAPDDIAYIIYTSGSTGAPKGVMVPQRALANLLWAVRERPGIDRHDVFVSVSSVAFDISGLEVFATLAAGARLVLATEREVVDGDALLSVMRRHRATIMFATPVTWQFLLAAGWNGAPRLKIMCGGEKMPRELAERLLATGSELWHVYGPTETTIYASVLRIDAAMLAQYATVPLGGPLPNLRFYVLDAHREPVPIGAPGELYIGGAQLARGYAGQPELTAARFVADPFSDDPQARLYRSGDIVRWRERERMEFIGRVDAQIKLRGFRIELGEVESALLRHRAVAEVFATLGRNERGDAGIWAYVSLRDPGSDAADLVEELMRDARALLPPYMLPSAITIVDALPRNQNGKVDQRALPVPVPLEADDGGPPRTATEQRLAAIWMDVLGAAAVGRAANFFELGGHSLLAARMLARIEHEFGTRIALSALFNAPTIAQLAPLLDSDATRHYDFRPVLRLRTGGARRPLLAINNTGIYFMLSRKLGSDQPFTTLQIFDPASDPRDLPSGFAEIAAAYVALIRSEQAQGPYRLLGWCVAGALAFEIACQLQAAGETVEQLVIIDGYVPGYVQRMPWLRRRLADTSHRLQLIALDIADLLRGRLSLRRFIANRGFAKRMQAWVSGRAKRDLLARRRLSPEDYDLWLLEHLRTAYEAYAPGRFDGRIQLLRSRRQPDRWPLDQDMGWSAFASRGAEVTVIDGDHFSMFQEPGVQQMAETIGRRPPP
ncbi:non-ribosomal peptide synthetase [Solimonas soli]|uniref:non-ribosomal peptide synthetase n=1 Tax=Solimonas soli TaxID=413479 RepID=UPI0004B58E59|nr:non-ribosomal peptide synthetase [Solimonas soli]